MFEAPPNAKFRVKGIETISNPHPYVIGPKHVAWASDHHSGLLGREAIESGEKQGITCQHPHCNLAYKEHKAEKALVVVLPNDAPEDLNSVEGLASFLCGIKAQMEEEGISGIMFPKERQLHE